MNRRKLIDIADHDDSATILECGKEIVPQLESEHTSFVDNHDVPRQLILGCVRGNESHLVPHFAAALVVLLIVFRHVGEQTMNRHDVAMPVAREVFLRHLTPACASARSSSDIRFQ